MNNIEPSGILIINKPSGITSHDVVGKIRKLYGTRRVGHTGTLDPMATGVLVILVGRAAKAAEYLVCDEKEYRAVLRLGITSDTEDVTGKILSSDDSLPSSSCVIEKCRKFTGKIMQTPPMYSALKVGGKKLVDLARQGIEIERTPRQIEIFSLSCTPTEIPSDYTLCVKCSSGTYIRTLCADIGKSLGCGGVMASLERTCAGGFGIDHAVNVEYIEGLSESGRTDLLIPTEALFDSLEKIVLPPFYERLCRSGCEIYQSKIKTNLPIGQRVSLYSSVDGFFGLGEVREFENGSAVKAIKLFSI